ncbi:hypothetical protein O982_12050 [Mycobacterium avium 10-5581]|nr:hypothetical protein O982_12050 [Mycobacterium avium 10-5581]
MQAKTGSQIIGVHSLKQAQHVQRVFLLHPLALGLDVIEPFLELDDLGDQECGRSCDIDLNTAMIVGF